MKDQVLTHLLSDLSEQLDAIQSPGRSLLRQRVHEHSGVHRAWRGGGGRRRRRRINRFS